MRNFGKVLHHLNFLLSHKALSQSILAPSAEILTTTEILIPNYTKPSNYFTLNEKHSRCMRTLLDQLHSSHRLQLPTKSQKQSSYCNRLSHPKIERTFIQTTMDYSKLNDNELRDRALDICREHLGGSWLKISSKEMSFTPVTGGLSNLLYCCSLPDNVKQFGEEPSQVLLRLYGEASRNTDMTLQVQIFELLSKQELGPKLFGNFEGGRLEEFLPAESLTCNELMNHDISSIIARKMAAVHSLGVPNMSKDSTWIMDRFNEWLEFFNTNRQLPEANNLKESTKKVAKALFAIDFSKEIKFMSKVFEGTKSPIVFSHNDLHQGNILLTRPTKNRSKLDKRVILIDFEYCSYNYRGYDIANHFSEWCFEYGTPEYPHFALYMDRFPSKDIQREFIRNYLDQKKRLSPGARNQSSMSNHSCHSQNVNVAPKAAGDTSKLQSTIEFSANHLYQRSSVIHQQLDGSQAVGKAVKLQANGYDKEVESILNEVVPFCMASNLVWALWCIKSAFSSNIKFGYWEHAMTRWQIYSSLKQSYINDRTTKRIKIPLATTIANGHSVSTPQLVSASSPVPEISN